MANKAGTCTRVLVQYDAATNVSVAGVGNSNAGNKANGTRTSDVELKTDRPGGDYSVTDVNYTDYKTCE